ncbi:hypothetical protein B6V00_01215 [ANME-1 cluster archaeon ex4572_4]|nr:MAG: hypothetical protein B6V00_01215 [ANME-1 cluster archaeon ex4572_4]
MREGVKVRVGVGELVRRAVEESVAWQSGGNTHFGALLLLVPLAVAAGAEACENCEPDLDPERRGRTLPCVSKGEGKSESRGSGV